MKSSKRFALGLTAGMLTLTSTAFAGGFQLYEASVSSLGNAFAGTGAAAQDASTEYYNPAGMTLLKHPQFVFAGTAIDLNTTAHINSASNTSTFIFPLIKPPIEFVNAAPVSGSSISHPGGWAFVPAFHFVYPWHKVALGFGITAPFGLETNYKPDSMARFLATESKLTVVNIGPNIAFQVTPELSIGAGFDVQYLKANLNQEVAINPTSIPLPPPISPTIPDIPAVDGDFRNEAHDIGYGWNAGVLYQITQNTRVGLAYRSKVTHRLEGTATLDIFNSSPSIEELESSFGNVSTSITLPDYANLSVYHAFNRQWAVLGGIDYTHWSDIQDLSLHFTGPLSASVSNVTVPLKFRNTWRFSAGVDFKPTSRWILRAGTAYDESPVHSVDTRTFRLPDANRYWLAVGAAYKINNSITIDAGYSHIFVKDASLMRKQVNKATFGPLDAVLVSEATADFDSNVNEFGLQLTWNLFPDEPAPPPQPMSLK